MGRTIAVVLAALALGATARAQGVAVDVAEYRAVAPGGRDGLPTELGRTIPPSAKQAVGPHAPKQAIQTTSLAEQARTIGLSLAMPKASLQSQPPRQASQGLRRSTKVRLGTAIGAGIGLSLAAGLCRSSDNCEPASLAAAAVVCGGTGAGIGALVGFLASQ